MEFRIDFFFRIVMDVIYYVVNIALFKILLLHTPVIAGWNEEQMMIFVGCYLIVDAINMTIFSTNMWWLPFYINRGDLDYYLIRPVSPLFFLSLREFSANSFVNLVIATGFFFHAIFSYSAPWDVSNLLVLLLLLINGTLVMYCLQMLMVLPVFWTQSTKGFIDLFYALGLAMERPDKIFRGWLRIFFTFIVPFGLIASYPARYFIDGFQTHVFLQLLGVSFVLWFFVILLWRLGLKNYASASS